MKKRFVISLIFILIFLIIIFLISLSLKKETWKENFIENFYLKDNGSIEVWFCPEDNCLAAFIDFINSSKQTLECAFYSLNEENLINLLEKKSQEIGLRMILDDKNQKRFSGKIKFDKDGLMHNKFCIKDKEFILTGSVNPTKEDLTKNRNNLLIIKSKILASNYLDEFNEMWEGNFKKGKKTKNPKISLNRIEIKNYFCPEDSCSQKVKEEIDKANSSIYFMTFSFTHPLITNALLIKKESGIKIKGIFEARQINQYSSYPLFLYQNFSIKKINEKGQLHHKVFIIDNQTVITGSFNPTKNGDLRNDENLLIIKNHQLAGYYLAEWEKIWENDLSGN